MRDEQAKGSCAVCGVDDPVELHHLIGRGNDPEHKLVVWLCRNHHFLITTDFQEKLAPSQRKHKASFANRRKFMLLSMAGLLQIIGKQLEKLGRE